MKRDYWIILALCLVVLGIRLFFVFQIPEMSYDSYFAVRQVDSITDHGFHFYEDELSYGGRVMVFSPFFYYVLAALSFFIPTLMAIKLLTNIFAVLLIPIVYLISKELTHKRAAALSSALFAAFIPVFFYRTLNVASVYSLFVPLTLALLYTLIKINDGKRYVYYFLTLLFVTTLTHPHVFLFVITLAFFFILVKLERLKFTRSELEASLLAVFFIFWLSFLIFKKSFLLYGLGFVWQNIPLEILPVFFPKLNVLTMIYEIGVIPFITGLFITYTYLFTRKDKKLYLLISFVFSVFLLMWLRMLQADNAMMFIGAVFAIFFGVFYEKFFSIGVIAPIIAGLFYQEGLDKMMKINKNNLLKAAWSFLLVLMIIFSSIVPSIAHASEIKDQAPSSEDIDALLWIKNNTDQGVTVAALIEEGYLINKVAERKNIGDLNFMLVDSDQRFMDIETIFNTPYQTVAVGTLDKYNAGYVFFSQRAAKKYGLEDLRYIDDNCFELVYENRVKVYKSLCRLR